MGLSTELNKLRLTHITRRASPSRSADATSIAMKAADASAIHATIAVRLVRYGNTTRVIFHSATVGGIPLFSNFSNVEIIQLQQRTVSGKSKVSKLHLQSWRTGQ